jgi:hypothetical protein
MSRLAMSLILVLLFAPAARAEEWRSPDGNMSVSVPSPARFASVNPTAPAVAQWESADRAVVLRLVDIPNPQFPRPERAAFEQSFAQEVQGKVVTSSVEAKDGYDFFTMIAVGTVGGDEVYVAQTVVFRGWRMYKAVATSRDDPRTDKDIKVFLASLTMQNPAPPPAPAQQKALSDTERLSRGLGGVGCFLLFMAGLLFILFRLGARRKPRRRPPAHDDEDDEYEDEDRLPRRRPRRDD